MTLPRTSRADRRREGLLASGEDPMLRRPPVRPSGGPPPGGGRRRTDSDPTAAPGRPPQTGERRQAPAAQSPARPAPAPQSPARPAPAAPTSGRPSPRPATSGPMTAAAAPAVAAAGRPARPSPRRDDASAPVRGATPAGASTADRAVAPHTTGMPSWAAEPAPPHDVTQRVSGVAPAESAWGAPAGPAAAAPAPARVPRTPAGPVRSGPPSTPPAARGVPTPAPRVVPERGAPDAAREQAPARKAVDVPVGGRAAARLERQAAEAARKKSGRRSVPPARPDGPAGSGPGRDADPATKPQRVPRRALQGLIALVVIAVAVLGFWSFTAPDTAETSAQSPVSSSAPVSTPAPEPVQESVAPSAEVTPTPAAPVRAPITVLNSTNITGLAGDIGDQFTNGGWEVTSTGPSPVEDVATTTVYFTEGDSVQQQAAAQLIEQFPDVSGPVPRYFELSDTPNPGLVVVATGNWQP
jgi:hypothetical protein